MAKYQKKKIEAMEGSRFGTYQEGVGGGASPQPLKPGTHGHGVNSDHRQENNDTMQPRTDDGKFTYKSVNGQSIDPKYGPSRGKTVNPLLTGGENGIMIEDVEKEFNAQSGAIWNKYKDKWYQKGGEYSLRSQGKGHKEDWATRVAGEDIWRVAKRRYDKVKGEFEGESKLFAKGKKGARTAEEEAAHQLSEQTGQEQAVINQKTGGIAVAPGTVPNKPLVAKKPLPKPMQGQTPSPSYGGQPVQPSAPVNTMSASDIANADYQPKYSDDDIESVKAVMKQAGFTDDDISDFENLSPKEKDDYIDTYFGEEEEEETEAPAVPEDNASEPEEKEENEDEAEKKLKEMGFGE